jgi:uncharacterized protein YjbI with pentapeptide repeats
LYNSSQTAQQNRRSDQAAQDTTLDAYFSQMSDLMLRKGKDNLRDAAPESAVRVVADAITGATISRLNTARQVQVAGFLSDAGIYAANLNGANLGGANLEFVALHSARLIGANLTGADLSGAFLDGANLKGANLNGANLSSANLSDTHLEGANLTGANLTGANLTAANLQGAFLFRTHFDGADLDGANLKGAHDVGEATFTGARFQNTTCPNGKITNTGC